MKYRSAVITSVIAALLAIGLDMASIQLNKGEISRISETLAGFLEQSQQAAQVNQAILPQPGESTAPPASTSSMMYEVAKVIDGDTLTLVPVQRSGDSSVIASAIGQKITVRLIGLDTPESVDPRKPVECFGKEASAFLKETIGDSIIRLEFDESQGEKDRYGRTLAYAYREDGLFLNLFMIEEGYGFEYTYDKPYQNQAKFKQAQAYAQYHQNGLWALGACDKIGGIRS